MVFFSSDTILDLSMWVGDARSADIPGDFSGHRIPIRFAALALDGAGIRVDCCFERQGRPVAHQVPFQPPDERANYTRTHQHAAVPRDDMNVCVSVGEKAREPFEQDAMSRDVDDSQFPACPQPYARQRFIGLWSATGGASPLRVVTSHKPIRQMPSRIAIHEFDLLLRARGSSTACRRDLGYTQTRMWRFRAV